MRTLWPVLERDLRVAARKPLTWRLRLGVSSAAVATLLLLVWFFSRAGMKANNGHVGSVVFYTVSGLCAIWALFLGCQRTADSLGRERRDGTLGLLFLTDLSGWDVVAGKLFAAMLDTVLQLLAVIPILVIPILLGGVGWAQVALLVVALVNGLVLSLSIGLFTSLLARDPRQAMGIAMAIILGLVFIPWAVFAYLTSRDQPVSPLNAAVILLASPLVPFLASFTSVPLLPAGMGIAAGFAAVGVQSLVSVLMLSVASRWVRVAWQEGTGPGWRARWNRFVDRVRFGGDARRSGWRRRWLEVGAWEWLSLREIWKPWLPWILVSGLIGLHVWYAFTIGLRDVLGNASGLLFFLFHLLFVFWVAGESAVTLATQKSNGATELLLTSGISPAGILQGQGRVLRHVLGGPVGVLIALDAVLLVWLPFSGQRWDAIAVGWWLHLTCLVLAPFQWFAVRWAVTRAILRGRPINQAVGLAINSALFLPGLATYGVFGGGAILLNLNSRIEWSHGVALGMGIPIALIAAWSITSGVRNRRWVEASFRESFGGS